MTPEQFLELQQQVNEIESKLHNIRQFHIEHILMRNSEHKIKRENFISHNDSILNANATLQIRQYQKSENIYLTGDTYD